MEIIVLAFSLLILIVGLNIKLKDLKELKKTNASKENLKLIGDVPDNIEICKEILKKFNNSKVIIENKTDEKSSYYIAISNKIIIGNVSDSFSRIQTVIHECIHSIQDRRVLIANYVLSSISNIYFLILIITAIINRISLKLFMSFFILQFICYVIRSFLENDAMIRAEYETEKYLKEKDCRNEKEIIEKYKNMNKIGIKLYNFVLYAKIIIKCIILYVLFLI